VYDDPDRLGLVFGEVGGQLTVQALSSNMRAEHVMYLHPEPVQPVSMEAW